MLNWLKSNRFVGILVVVLVFLFILQFFKAFFGTRLNSLSVKPVGSSIAPMVGRQGEAADMGIAMPEIYPTEEYIPQSGVKDRLVIQESNMSLLVKDVVETRDSILKFVEQNGGYMVNVATSNPQDAPTSTVSIRVPQESLGDTLNYFRSLSIKVVSENLHGRDVTDQYIDLDTRIAQLESTKARFEELLSKATQISELTSLTSQVLNYQTQIDNLKGQKMALEKNADLAKLTVFLSTDEIALPYAPSETFRPKVIFKLAVRSLVSSLRDFATVIIWVAVYSVIWLPLILLVRWIYSRFSK